MNSNINKKKSKLHFNKGQAGGQMQVQLGLKDLNITQQ